MATFLGIDYPTLWFLVIGALFSGYAILDGFDFGAGAWHLLLKDEKSRRIALNAVGPVWDGNEVWLVIGGGALFSGFPRVYATVFSAMYIPFMLFLFFIIMRAVSIEFRSKEAMAWWRRLWDICYSVSSIALALLLGVVLGNVLQGIALDERQEFSGHWITFLNPYALLVGLCTLSLMMMHGAIYLTMKTEGALFGRVEKFVKKAITFFLIVFAITTIATLASFPHLRDRFTEQPMLSAIPLLAFLSILNVPRLVSKKRYLRAFLFSSFTFSFLLILVAIELYPVLVLSSISPDYSLTVYNAASSQKSLGVMLTIVAIGSPLVALYTVFVYRTFWGKVKLDENSY
jgi:cytochrome bd ubiquinol oxidase subunit II